MYIIFQVFYHKLSSVRFNYKMSKKIKFLRKLLLNSELLINLIEKLVQSLIF